METASTMWAVVKWDVFYGASYFLMVFSDNLVSIWVDKRIVDSDKVNMLALALFIVATAGLESMMMVSGWSNLRHAVLAACSCCCMVFKRRTRAFGGGDRSLLDGGKRAISPVRPWRRRCRGNDDVLVGVCFLRSTKPSWCLLRDFSCFRKKFHRKKAKASGWSTSSYRGWSFLSMSVFRSTAGDHFLDRTENVDVCFVRVCVCVCFLFPPGGGTFV